MEKLKLTAPAEIERESFRIIREELAAMGKQLDPETEDITVRIIHATADFDFSDSMVYSPGVRGAIESAIRSGGTIVTDTNMALAGISRKALERFGADAVCFMADPDVAEAAKERGVTRAAVSMERAAQLHGPVVLAVGNAPTALIRIRELMDTEGFRPAAVLGLPVGFVNVTASKELILSSGVPHIVSRGRKGGSTVAAAAVNAVLYGMDPMRGAGR